MACNNHRSVRLRNWCRTCLWCPRVSQKEVGILEWMIFLGTSAACRLYQMMCFKSSLGYIRDFRIGTSKHVAKVFNSSKVRFQWSFLAAKHSKYMCHLRTYLPCTTLIRWTPLLLLSRSCKCFYHSLYTST